MRKSPLGLLLLLLTFLAACTGETGEAETHGSGPATQNPAPEEVSKPEYLHRVEAYHAFSDPEKPDHFIATLMGDDTLKGNWTLHIIRHTGDTIYNQSFGAEWLLDYGIDFETGEAEREAYIIQRLDSLFIERNFKPAVRSELEGEHVGDHIVEPELFSWLKQNRPDAISFFYLVGSEDGRHLVYDPRSGRVVMYFNCC